MLIVRQASVEKTKGLAAQRHQLTSLLSTAYASRQEVSLDIDFRGKLIMSAARGSHRSELEEHACREAEVWYVFLRVANVPY